MSLFVTFSERKSLLTRVPMVGLPVDFDQPDNMAFLKDRGAAEQIYPHDDDTRILRTLKKVIGGKGYTISQISTCSCFNLQSCAEKRDCFAKHQPGVAGCGWLQSGRHFLST